MRVRVFALSGNAKDYRTSSHGLVFYVNGQTHAHKSIDFFRRRAVGMSQIAESLVVLVDCTEIQGRMREDLFMNSRDRLRDDELAVRLERELERILSSEQALKALRNRRREEEIAERLDDSKPLANALGDLVRQSPLLKKLLGSGIAVPSPFPTSGTGRGGASDFEGKPFPTYFRFKGKADDEELHRPAHLGSRVRVAFETDAADDYFHRDLDPGAAEVLVDTGEGRVPLTGWSFTGPRSGVANLQFDLPAGSRVDDTIPFEVRITDPSRIDAFGNSGELTIRKEAKPSSGGSGERDRNRNAGKGSGGALTGLSLPEIIPVHEDNWEKHDFDELSGLKVVHQGHHRVRNGQVRLLCQRRQQVLEGCAEGIAFRPQSPAGEIHLRTRPARSWCTCRRED
ncbi:MAG: hypothetical protein M5U31_04420 [Acidimicrobiia bacterium]|nr:hypothetical protein [Acidimicrobiia bacterium]